MYTKSILCSELDESFMYSLFSLIVTSATSYNYIVIDDVVCRCILAMNGIKHEYYNLKSSLDTIVQVMTYTWSKLLVYRDIKTGMSVSLHK